MSFGFSIGDFIAVGKTISDISSYLQDSKGSKTEYQDLLRELECLQQALGHLDKLHNTGSVTLSLDSIKYAALSCRRPLEQFLQKIQKFDKSLGVWGKGGIVKTTTDKLRWGFGQKEEIRKLQSYLNIHVGTINILLAEHGLEHMELASEKSAAQQLQIRNRLDNTHSVLQKLTGSLALQALVIDSTQKMLSGLCQMISGEIKSSIRSIADIVAKVCVTTQQSYSIMLEVKSSLAGPDIRCAYFQAPLIVEDALGYRFPVPSEYDFDLLDAVIKQKFNSGPGSLNVQTGNYEYFKTRNSRDVLSKATRLLPGTAIAMAILVFLPTFTDETCPMPHCRSIRTLKTPGGGRTCCECNVWFSPTQKKRRSLQDLLFAISATSNPFNADGDPNSVGIERINKRARLAPNEEDVEVFKNIRLSLDEIPIERSISTATALTANSGSHPLEFRKYHGQHENHTNPTDPEADADVYASLPPEPAEDGEETLNISSRDPVEFKDALSFIKKVKARFGATPDVYQQFLKILQEYQLESKPVQDVYKKVSNLFIPAPDLMEGFDMFLPESAAQAKMRGQSKASPGYIENKVEVGYVDKVKARFIDSPGIYNGFLSILKIYETENTPIEDVHTQIEDLLHSAPDLCEEFKQFLPGASASIQSATTSTFDEELDEGRRKRKRFAD